MTCFSVELESIISLLRVIWAYYVLHLILMGSLLATSLDSFLEMCLRENVLVGFLTRRMMM